MTIKQILSEITIEKTLLSPERYPKYSDVLSNIGNGPFTLYPDGSRSFDDIISIIGMITSDGSPLLSILGSFLLHRQAGASQYYIDDGLCTSPHTHNYAELGYVVEGQFHTHIGGRNYLLNKGELFLINKNIPHREYLYRKNSAVLFLSIVNTFFDKTLLHEVYDSETEKFIQRFVADMGGNKQYNFVRFIPKEKNGQIPDLFEKILVELWRPHPGTTYLIIGYVEWILNLLPVEYKILVQRNYRTTTGEFLFKEIRRYLEEYYQNTAVDDLIKQYGHNRNYFNLLIKKHTGMTYSAFLQNIRLEKAEFLLKTTGFTVEEIALQVGYEDLSYFYRIFQKKFNKTPKYLRKSTSS
jgi:AraC-like DNA-binding protein